MLPTALVVQCFVKVDTLRGACESLLKCDGIQDLHLIFWSDNPIGSRNEAKFGFLQAGVDAYVQCFIESEGQRFRSVEYRTNPTNLGAYKTCELALDHAFKQHPFAILVEDDVVFSRDALLWFDAIRRQRLLDDERYWAIAGESVFFDAREKPVSPEWVAAMCKLAVDEELSQFYALHNFIPSTCFATTAEKWQQFGQTRGEPVGDVKVCERCAEEGRYGIFPLVPRIKDVGMLHEHGYSVLIHSREGVTSIKNAYLMSDDLIAIGEDAPNAFHPYKGHEGRLFSISTLLHGAEKVVTR